MNNGVNDNGRKQIAQALSELKDDLKQFAVTRYEMLRSELRDKVRHWKVAIPLLAAGIVLLGTAWLLLTVLFVVLIAGAMSESQWAYPIAIAIVTLVYAIVGAILGVSGSNSLKAQSVVPEKTLRVLKDDQQWLQAEARSQS